MEKPFTEFDFDIPEHREMGDIAEKIAKDHTFRRIWTINIKDHPECNFNLRYSKYIN